MAVFRNVLLAAGEVVPQQQVKDPGRLLRVVRQHLHQTAGLRIHGGHPHHLRVVLTKTLGALDADLFAGQLPEDIRLLLLGIGEPRFLRALFPAGDLKQRRFRDIDLPLPDQGGAQAIQHGQDQRPDLEAVHVAIGADDHLAPAEVVQVKLVEVLDRLALHLHAAAQHLHQVGDDVAFEDAGIVGLQAVEDLAPDGHQALKFRVAGLLAGAQRGVALHDVQLPALHVLGAAVHKLLDAVGDVDLLRQLLFLVDAGLFRRLTAAFVDQHLSGDLLCRVAVLDEIDLQTAAEELRHGVLNELVGDGLLGLVFVAGLGGEVVADQDQAVLHVGIGDLGLGLQVLVVLPQVLVDGAHHGKAGGLLRTASVLQKAGVVVVLHHGHPVGKAQRHAELDLVLRLVGTVPAPALRLPAHRLGEGVIPRQLGDIVPDATGIQKLLGVEFALRRLVQQPERDTGIDHRLTLHGVPVVVKRHGDIGEHVQIRQPVDTGAGLFLVGGQLLYLQAADVLALFKMKAVLLAAAPDGHVHIPGGVLGGAGAKAVEAQGELIVLAVFVVVLAAGVQLAEHQLPVVAPLLLVPVHRAAAAHVLHLHRLVQKTGDGDETAVALPGLVDGVGEDLKHGVLAALQPIGAENDAGPLADTVRALETGDAVVVVYVLLWHRGKTSKGCRIHIADSPIYCNPFSAAAQGACRRFPAPPGTFLV